MSVLHYNFVLYLYRSCIILVSGNDSSLTMDKDSTRSVSFSERVAGAAHVLASVFHGARVDLQRTNSDREHHWVSRVCRYVMIVSIPRNLRITFHNISLHTSITIAL